MQFSSSESQCSITDSCMMNLPFFRCTLNGSKTSRGTQGMGDETREQVLDELILQLLAAFGSVGVSCWITLISRGLWTLICWESALHVPIPCEDAGGTHSLRDVACSDKFVWGCETPHATSAFNTFCFWRILWPILRTLLLKGLGSVRFLKVVSSAH